MAKIINLTPHPEGGEIFEKEDIRWVQVNLPTRYKIHRWAPGGTFGTHLESLRESVSVPVKVRVRIEGGGLFIYGSLVKMNEGRPIIIEVLGPDWEVGNHEIRFPNTKPNSVVHSCLRGISMPPVPREVNRVDLGGVEPPPRPEPLERRFFAARRELLQRGGKEALEREWPKLEPEIQVEYEGDLAVYEQALAEYQKLEAQAKVERDRRVRQWKEDNNILELPELAAFIEAEVRRYFDERG